MGKIYFENGQQFQISGEMAMTCGSAHYWVWAGNPNYPLPEGYPCACGQMLWHMEKCKECGNAVVKPKLKGGDE